MEPISRYLFLMNNLTIYNNVMDDPALSALSECFEALDSPSPGNAVSCYAKLCLCLYKSEGGGSLWNHIAGLVRYDSNPFSLACARGDLQSQNKFQHAAALQDIKALGIIASVSCGELTKHIAEELSLPETSAAMLPRFADKDKDSFDFTDIRLLEESYRANGYGVFGKYHAFQYDNSLGLLPIPHYDPVRLSSLKEYELQKKMVVGNTLAFLHGLPYHNVLLYGDRGTGKSSTVKALLNEFSGMGLRMVELSKQNIVYIDRLIALLSKSPMKFIIFIDDLSFSEDDERFGIMKALLEGSLASRPQNVAIYATTNRRHLVKETFSSREGNEIHRADTVDETLSLSDRFGLTVTFLKPDKAHYIKIVDAMVEDLGLNIPKDELVRHAEQFALQKSARTPRVARQFVDDLYAKQALQVKTSERKHHN